MSERNERIRWQLGSGLLRLLHLNGLRKRVSPRLALAAASLINATFSASLLAMLAFVTQEVFIFPSLGATAFLLFYLPLAEASSPRNVLSAHTIGASLGFASLLLFGLGDAGSALIDGVTLPRVAAISFALGLTCFLMVLLRVAHPPAAATALMVALGSVSQWHQIQTLLLGILLLLTQAFILNRLIGIPYPLWARRETDTA
ncbi:HPP family protein [Isoalcanivorax beigongshangi]|uniref:HPP family protein n=1 Tax=Isoalcanivorax beigongshangi TaxID=3238810 RepID=A0ABV4AIR1_9GAMM